ncbi:EAL domain-containing protein [Vibrio mediterranei]|uniref:EAL domain-containing protein n=1 Tax=Vibrio mediterranei TaxID=689 RepID=UPI00228423DA|nr:EAL domain-containing protein [Vibrio mediterranei]MCY9851386.1 EAL domain-containing protein [Vibrio mediterranei]
MLSTTHDENKTFWSEDLSEVTSVISKGEFWRNVLCCEDKLITVQPPSIDYVNQILLLIRDVQFNGLPAAVPIALETTTEDLFIVKFEIYLILDNKVKGSVELLSQSQAQISVFSMIEHLLDDPHRGVLVTNHEHNVLFTNNRLCYEHNVSPISVLGRNISDIQLLQSDSSHMEVFKSMISQASRWQGAVITRARDSHARLETISVKKIELSDGKHIFVYIFFGDNFTEKSTDNSAHINFKQETAQDEASFRKSASELSKKNGKYIVISFKPHFYSELEKESRGKVLVALKSSHDKSSFGYLGRNTFIALVKIRQSDVEDLATINLCIKQFFKGMRKYLDDHLVNDIADGQVGVALHGFNGCGIDEVISQSVQAMFVHDSSGSSVNFYDEKLVQGNIRRKRLEQLLIDAIRNKAIDVNFQPIVDTHTGEIVKLEALCRFRFQDMSYTVQEMIHLAEELKLISALDLMVAERAIEEFVSINSGVSKKLSLSLNCSIAESGQPSIHLLDLFELIKRSPVDNDAVTIEITETAYFENNVNNANLLEKIRSAGIKIAVDDFGTGSSSFSYFNDFHFDELKIDRKFITNINEVKQKYFAVNMLRQLSHDLNIKVVAEGVEKVSELETLKSIDVDYIQGYFFYRPLSSSQVREVLKYASDAKRH